MRRICGILLLLCCWCLPVAAQDLVSLHKPAVLQEDEAALLGIYTGGGSAILVREEQGKLQLLYKLGREYDRAHPKGFFSQPDIFTLTKNFYDDYTMLDNAKLMAPDSSVRFERDIAGRGATMRVGNRIYTRYFRKGEAGKPYRFTLPQAWEALQQEALQAQMPVQKEKLQAQLVDLTSVVPHLQLDLRYASNNNVFGHPLVQEKRALLDKEAAEALKLAQQELATAGYGLVVWEAYRPWQSFKLMTLALPADFKDALPPATGFCAMSTGRSISVGLYNLEEGAAAALPCDFDAVNDLAQFPDYPAGTSEQRYHCEILRRAMVQAGFTASPEEWWHFDFQPEKAYQMLNQPL